VLSASHARQVDHRGVGVSGVRECGGMRVVIVFPPDEAGGRAVRVGGVPAGRACSVRDVAGLLEGSGLAGVDEGVVRVAAWIEWRGGGPDVWVH
jgi:hypothetical protein